MSLTPDQIRRLERISNRNTLYELIATNDDGRTVLIVYCRKSKPGAWSALRERDNARAKALVDLTGSETIDFNPRSFGRTGIVGTTGPWTIKFSGRTQREAIIEGEHPYILDSGETP